MSLSESLGKKLIVTSKKIHKKHLQIKQISKNSFPKKSFWYIKIWHTNHASTYPGNQDHLVDQMAVDVVEEKVLVVVNKTYFW